MTRRRTRVKFCGITQLADALAAIDCGVDALGFVFHPASPRYLAPEQAGAIIAALPPFVCTVGLFVDAPAEFVRDVVTRTRLDLVQYHGAEDPERCRAVARPYVKAIAMKPDLDLAREAGRYGDAAALLLDTYHPTLAGGTGQGFDWTRVPAERTKPIVLAGGLTADNVAAAIAAVGPYAVDVSGGIEQSKGIKDPVKMRAFMSEVSRFERS
jgi:phosphoribosylanthranilate isomerase